MRGHRSWLRNTVVLSVGVIGSIVLVGLQTASAAVKSPLYSFYYAAADFHFYTANPDERASLKQQPGWKEYGQMGYVFREQVPGTIPLYRLSKMEFGGANHFYTIDKKEANSAAGMGWTPEGVCCYVSKTPVEGTVPLYRLYKGVNASSGGGGSLMDKIFGAGPAFEAGTGGDVHFYTIFPKERDAAMGSGFQFIRNEAYVWEKAMLPVKKAPAATQAEIEDVYQKAFGRAPSNNELAHWTAEAKNNGYSWAYIFNEQEKFLKTDAAQFERKGMVNRCYYEVFGRYASVGEMNMWTDIIAAKGLTYMFMIKQYVDYLTGGNPAQNLELKATILRAYKSAGFAEPNQVLLQKWISKTINEKLTFKKIVAGVKGSTFPNGPNK